jgi:hypothetical protein
MRDSFKPQRGKMEALIANLSFLVSLTFVLSLFACSYPHKNLFLEGLALKDFEQAGPLVVYNKINLYNYIDGEADVYLPFGFRLLYTQAYRHKQTGAQMMAEVYDMGTKEGATSVFSKFILEQGSLIPHLGETAWTGSGMVLFHRDQYYLKLYADPSPEPEVKPSPEELVGLSFVIDQAIEH